MRTIHRPAMSAVVLALCCAVSLSLTSCSLTGSGRSDLKWATAKQLAQSNDADRVPTLVASDSEKIRFSAAEIGSGPTVISWQSTTGIVREDCKAGAIAGAPTSSVPGWWPKRVPADGWTCGWWRVFQKDGSYYSWQQRSTQS